MISSFIYKCPRNNCALIIYTFLVLSFLNWLFYFQIFLSFGSSRDVTKQIKFSGLASYIHSAVKSARNRLQKRRCECYHLGNVSKFEDCQPTTSQKHGPVTDFERPRDQSMRVIGHAKLKFNSTVGTF